MEFRVLGPLEVVQDGHAVPVRGSRRRLLLATLLVHRNLVVTVDRLVDVLFGDDPPARAVSTVQSYVSRLRSDLGGAARAADPTRWLPAGGRRRRCRRRAVRTASERGRRGARV